MTSERDYNGTSTNTSEGTYTGRPSYMTEQEHVEAERQGWSVFEVERRDRDGKVKKYGEVQRIDELELVSDEEAVILARRAGLVVLGCGRVLARWGESKGGLKLMKIDEPLPLRTDVREGYVEVDLSDEDLVEGLEGVFEQVRPDECGALTDGLILSREVERSDEGEVVKLGDVFWDADYQVRNLWDTLDEKGAVELRRVRD